jgi:hypothetical protein
VERTLKRAKNQVVHKRNRFTSTPMSAKHCPPLAAVVEIHKLLTGLVSHQTSPIRLIITQNLS